MKASCSNFGSNKYNVRQQSIRPEEQRAMRMPKERMHEPKWCSTSKEVTEFSATWRESEEI
jgi:hypothetical protein